MGNSLSNRKMTKIMKINGETFKLKTPVRAGEVTKDYPGYVLLESESVKHYGTRSKPLEPQQNLQAKRLYFLVELPTPPKEHVPRRVRSGVHMSAKDKLESLLLARRSISDLSLMKPGMAASRGSSGVVEEEREDGGVRVKLRLKKEDVERVMRESKTEEEAAQKLMALCRKNDANSVAARGDGMFHHNGSSPAFQAREKRVSFVPINEGGNEIAVAS